MPWIKVIDESEADGPLREAYAAVRGARGQVANILKVHSVRPRAMRLADIEDLRAAGLSDGAIHDAAAVVAYFNSVNRIALGLGVELER